MKYNIFGFVGKHKKAKLLIVLHYNCLVSYNCCYSSVQNIHNSVPLNNYYVVLYNVWCKLRLNINWSNIINYERIFYGIFRMFFESFFESQ